MIEEQQYSKYIKVEALNLRLVFTPVTIPSWQRIVVVRGAYTVLGENGVIVVAGAPCRLLGPKRLEWTSMCGKKGQENCHRQYEVVQ